VLAAFGHDRLSGWKPSMLGTGLKNIGMRSGGCCGWSVWRSSSTTPTTPALGHQKRMEISRLALRPKVLMLDEPFAGLSEEDIVPLAGVIQNLQREGLSILLIEHNIPHVMELCSRLAVLNFGENLCDGPPETVRKDPRVISAYLGS
jgi:branched-chain amino acid transport system ATP-binding protein